MDPDLLSEYQTRPGPNPSVISGNGRTVDLRQPLETMLGEPAEFGRQHPDGRVTFYIQRCGGRWGAATWAVEEIPNQLRNVATVYEIRPDSVDPTCQFPHPLTFAQLQYANRLRDKAWGKGQDISYLFNAVELGGEAGEVLNAVKKFYRHEIGIAGGEPDKHAIEKELGDVIICCSILANKLGIDLGKAVAEKFNKTGEKYGFPHRLVA